MLIVGLLGLGLLALLLLNTASAQDAFRLSDLQRQSKALADQEQSLSRQAADFSDPTSLAAAAAKLGMVPGAVPIFLPPGQKVPAGQLIGSMIVVPAPRSTQPAQPVAGAQPTSTPKPKSPTKPAQSKAPATTSKSLPPAVIEAMRNFYNFQKFTNYIKTHQQAGTATTGTGSHP